ncbi:CRISPR-associated helicase Cas3' [Psychromonas antarctica]|uniref:CRISPR-associated helicase Cas3' n=1 Tax=Psychromonas antarctica TaxID=67573 RepID=UPI001EE7C44F|nr:CRISPR-associated helicase Cas3' [Psychromonas antarctica]MCG6201149.1 CRISPR-associated helicase Cas3' [Psychromonas antarctica]
MNYIAHPAEDGVNHQSVEAHLFEASKLAGMFAKKINQEKAGELIGLLHDFGKYSRAFQVYILSAAGLIDSGDQEYVDAKALKGKIDHSTAGAQYLYDHLLLVFQKQYSEFTPGEAELVFVLIQALAQSIVSHHSGLIDSLPEPKGKCFGERISKLDEQTHRSECSKNVDCKLLEKIKELTAEDLLKELLEPLNKFIKEQQSNFNISDLSKHFYLGLHCKFMFSCLIDADRISSADFEIPENKKLRSKNKPDWDLACQRVEKFVKALSIRNPIDEIRRTISNNCKNRAIDPQGIYSLTVPTGGGKTYSSLRYAVQHAKKHQLDRIIYIIPYTSIIDQNAQAIRGVIESKTDNTSWVFEHHSNIEPEQQTWRSKLVSENWDAPIVLTTMVQFLETLFSGGTRGVRRLHQLANSVLIFDEIQTLPINCTHLFCNSINFLSAYCNTTTVLCTATQPLLNQLKDSEKGQLQLSDKNELMPNVSALFEQLKRVEIFNNTKTGGWSLDEITQLALEELKVKKSCLVIVNTKKWAHELYVSITEFEVNDDNKVFHLSTSQCPAHRKQLLDEIRARLDQNLPTLCISTALIEAGVDVDFNSVIRFLAGLDSITQAAGRCNRNGHLESAKVLVVNPEQENIDLLIDIKQGISSTQRIFNEYKGLDLLKPEIMKQYFEYYFFERAKEMDYPFTEKKIGKGDSILNLLSVNALNRYKDSTPFKLKQSFMIAGKLFKAIDAPTKSLIVPFKDGKELITELCLVSKKFDAKTYYDLVKKAQKYSVNLFPYIWQKLADQDAIVELQNEQGEGDGIFYLNERFYSEEFGVNTEICADMNSCIL